MPFAEPLKRKAYTKQRYKEKKEQIREQQLIYTDDLKQHAISSLVSGEIIDPKKWEPFCNSIKRKAKYVNFPYSEDFTSVVMFGKMSKGCFYCMDIALTIDRVNSNNNHTPDNCVGSCLGCNVSKGNADPYTFIRKAWYRTNGNYYDNDTNIWSDNVNPPRFDMYKKRATKKGVPFDISSEYFAALTVDKCAYCHRYPETGRWNGIDRISPSKGYTDENVVSCCNDCNIDKASDDVYTMTKRNKRISDRMINKELVISDYDKALLTKGTQSASKKVCVNGKLYKTQNEASRENGRYNKYVSNCIERGKHPDRIFTVSNDFYEQYKNKDDITLEMYINWKSAIVNNVNNDINDK